MGQSPSWWNNGRHGEPNGDRRHGVEHLTDDAYPDAISVADLAERIGRETPGRP